MTVSDPGAGQQQGRCSAPDCWYTLPVVDGLIVEHSAPMSLDDCAGSWQPPSPTPPARDSGRDGCTCDAPLSSCTPGCPCTSCDALRDSGRDEAREAVCSSCSGEMADDCGHHSWAGLMALLDEHWPADIFPTVHNDSPSRDAGARIVSLMRWVDELKASQ